MGVHELEKYIRQFFGVAADDLEKICSLFQTVQLERGSFFLKRGGRSDRLGFVQHGI